MSSLNRLNIAEGVYFNSVRDSRFKTMKLSANLFVPLSAETASENAFVPARHTPILPHSAASLARSTEPS